MITSYTPKTTGDVLIAILAPDVDKNLQKVEIKNNIARIFNSETNETIGLNFWKVSELLPDLKGEGQVYLSQADADALNAALSTAGFDIVLSENPSQLRVGYIDEMVEHPDSDHLHITQVIVDNNEKLQIVCGSPNISEHIKVVVAKPGTMMPSGALIWPGALRGVESNGMIASGRELRIPGAPNKPGALILDDDFAEIGDVFDFDKAQHIFEK